MAGMCAAVLAIAAPATAVGLGPLAKSGLTNGPRKAFFLQLTNPYRQPTRFRAYAVGMEDEEGQPRITIMPAVAELGAGGTRRLLVIAGELAPGETYQFRVCAERDEPIGMINARVCSKLAARRIPAAG